jgi:uncharacterized membrane protein
MSQHYLNCHLQDSLLGGVVNTIIIRNIRDLVSCAKLAVYYHISVGRVVVKLLVVHMGVNIVSRPGELLIS